MGTGEELARQLAHLAQMKAVRARKRRLARAPASPRRRAGASPRQKQGNEAEERACRHLRAAGVIVLERNLRCKSGEIDLIVFDHGTLAFVEVRYRASDSHGGAAASVNRQKRQRLIRAARYFLPAITRRHFSGRMPPCRFDVVTLDSRGTIWLRQAFLEDAEP